MRTGARLKTLLSRTALLAVVLGSSSMSNVLSASAHNGKTHIEGTVSSIEKKKLVVQQPNGRRVSIRLRAETSYRLRETGVQTTAADLAIGCQVFVESFGMPGAEQDAIEVLIATPTRTPTEPATE